MVIKDLFSSARERIRDTRSLLLLFGIYVGLLASAALFIVTSVATVKQVLISLAMIVIVPAIFCLLAAVCLTPREGKDYGHVVLLNWLRVTVISLPVFVGALILFRLIGFAQTGLIGKPSLAMTVLRVAVFGIALPLLLIQLWIATVSDGLKLNWTSIRATLSRPFSPRPLLTYVLGIAISGALAYALFYAKVPFAQQNAEVASLLIRVVLALLVVFFGWIVTLTAMKRALSAIDN
jgi:hypothetical protein